MVTSAEIRNFKYTNDFYIHFAETCEFFSPRRSHFLVVMVKGGVCSMVFVWLSQVFRSWPKKIKRCSRFFFFFPSIYSRITGNCSISLNLSPVILQFFPFLFRLVSIIFPPQFLPIFISSVYRKSVISRNNPQIDCTNKQHSRDAKELAELAINKKHVCFNSICMFVSISLFLSLSPPRLSPSLTANMCEFINALLPGFQRNSHRFYYIHSQYN